MPEPISPNAFRRSQAAAALVDQASELVRCAVPEKPEDYLWLLDELARILGEVEAQRPDPMPLMLVELWTGIDARLPRLHGIIDACREAATLAVDKRGQS